MIIEKDKIKVISKDIPGFSYMTFSVGTNKCEYSKGQATRIKISHENGPYDMRIKVRGTNNKVLFDSDNPDHNGFDLSPLEVTIDLSGGMERDQFVEGIKFIMEYLSGKLLDNPDPNLLFDIMHKDIRAIDEDWNDNPLRKE
jgi:hypothetical protein